jgi:hypothetical protein
MDGSRDWLYCAIVLFTWPCTSMVEFSHCTYGPKNVRSYEALVAGSGKVKISLVVTAATAKRVMMVRGPKYICAVFVVPFTA